MIRDGAGRKTRLGYFRTGDQLLQLGLERTKCCGLVANGKEKQRNRCPFRERSRNEGKLIKTRFGATGQGSSMQAYSVLGSPVDFLLCLLCNILNGAAATAATQH